MSKKNVYFYELVVEESQSGKAIPVENYRTILTDIILKKSINGSIELTYEQTEPVLMDVLENTDEYLFARLSRKRPNNSIQKRNYKTRKTTDVLAPDEIGNNGIECFTYCFLGYTHGILSIAKSKGAPGAEAFSMLFAMHKREYTAETFGIPNNDLIKELIDGKAPQVNRISIDIARPSAELLEGMFRFEDAELIAAMSRKTASLVVDVKPDFRGYLIDDPSLISKLVEVLRKNQTQYNSIRISGKKDGRGPQREYDLYEEYFKYPIDIKEYKQEGGRKIEMSKAAIQCDYKDKMTKTYDQYKDILLIFVDRQ